MLIGYEDKLERRDAKWRPISAAEKIRILLAEHGTLRAEIIARTGHIYQMIGYGVAAIILLIGLAPAGFIFYLMLALVILIFAFGLWFFGRYTLLCGLRIREIELAVNDRAQEDLLVWENLWSGLAIGFFGLRQPLPRSHLGGLKPPIRTWRSQEI